MKYNIQGSQLANMITTGQIQVRAEDKRIQNLQIGAFKFN